MRQQVSRDTRQKTFAKAMEDWTEGKPVANRWSFAFTGHMTSRQIQLICNIFHGGWACFYERL